MVFAACLTPQMAHTQLKPSHPINLFQTPFMAPISPPNEFREMANQVQFLEKEVARMSGELRIRADMSKREKEARTELRRECSELREEVSKMKSVLELRDRQITELERQLRASQTQLVLLKRRHAAASAAVTAKPSPVPGSISSLPKEMRTIGLQVDEINGLEERIEKLSEALLSEKRRNIRIKSLLVEEEHSSNPPRPSTSDARGQSSPPARRKFHTQSIATTVIHKPIPRLKGQTYIELNCKSIPVIPPVVDSRSSQTDFQYRSDSPAMISPIRRVDHSSFAVFEEKENKAISPVAVSQKSTSPIKVLMESRANNKALSIETCSPRESSPIKPIPNTSPETSSSQSSTAVPGSSPWTRAVIPAGPRTQPLPFVPPLNLAQIQAQSPSSTTSTPMSASSESAIKRAVALAVEKRKQLASHGLLLGSARSSIAGSFIGGSTPMSTSGVKARFCVL
jgi:hypothetical protein